MFIGFIGVATLFATAASADVKLGDRGKVTEPVLIERAIATGVPGVSKHPVGSNCYLGLGDQISVIGQPKGDKVMVQKVSFARKGKTDCGRHDAGVIPISAAASAIEALAKEKDDRKAAKAERGKGLGNIFKKKTDKPE